MLTYYGKPKLNPRKAMDTCVKAIVVKDKGIKWTYYNTIVKIVDLMRLNLTFDQEGILDLLDKHCIPTMAGGNNLIADSLKVFNIMLSNTRQFDFCDMVFVPAVNDEIELRKFDYAFIDECQDLNKAQQEIMKRIKKYDGRFIAVGDPHQSIYGFAGADVESFNKLAEMPNTQNLPLSVCYRCSKSVVKIASSIVPHIEAFEGSPEGEVRTGSVSEIGDGDWVLCRNVKPLIILCLRLIKSGEKAVVRGNDIGKAIINMLKRTKQNNKKMAYYIIKQTIKQQKQQLADWGVGDPDNHSSVIDMQEKMEVVEYIGEDCKDVAEIIHKLEKVFGDEKRAGILLSTIHKSKGLENNRIFLICPDLMPSRFAIKDWQLEQEKNLEYVAYTRAKSELVITDDFEV